MNIPLIEIVISGVIISSAVLSVIFTLGIVWRAEKELDISYKLFALSIIAFTLSEILTVFRFEGRVWASLAILVFKLIFAICFLAGILIMRDILRRMDGEKRDPVLSPEEHDRPI